MSTLDWVYAVLPNVWMAGEIASGAYVWYTPDRNNPTITVAMTLKASLGEAYARIRERTARQLERQKELYNRRIHGHPFKVDHVWVLFPQVPQGKSRKLYRSWSGQFDVVKKLSDVTYRMQEIKTVIEEWLSILSANI